MRKVSGESKYVCLRSFQPRLPKVHLLFMKPFPGKPCSIGETSDETVRSAVPDGGEFQRELARLVIQQRKRRGWSQEQLAKKAKLSVATIRQVENNHGNRLRLKGGFRLFGLLGLRVRFCPVDRPTAKSDARLKRIIQRGKKHLANLVKRLPPRKLRGLMCTTNEFEFLFEAARLVVHEGW